MPRSALAPRLIAAVLISFALPYAAHAADEDEDNGRAIPGLIATYFSPGSDQPAFTRYDAAPAFLLGPGEAPDPRLPAKGWRVEWKGVLQVLHPGQHQFFANAQGKLEVRLDGKPILSGSGNDLKSAETNLSFGRHPLEIKFTPNGDATELKLSWQAEAFAREPLPTFAVGHERTAPPVNDPFPLGRLEVEEHSCTACHAPSPQVALSRELVKRPGPKLTDAGSRLKAGYIYHWLGNPSVIRPEAVMPSLFGDDENSKTERYAIAHFLAARGKLPEHDKEKKEEDILKDAKQGEQLFAKTGCVVCHEKQSDRPARVTLQTLGQKTVPAVIAKFIENPGEHDPAGRMPGFTFRDHNDFMKLAYYLTRRDAGTAPTLELPPESSPESMRAAFVAIETDPNAQQKFFAAKKDAQIAQLAKKAMQAKHCMNCHEMNVKGEEKDWKPEFAKTDFAAVCAKPEGGCLTPLDGRQHGHIPMFGPSLNRDRAIEFLNQVLKIPGTPAPGEFARLTLDRLNCLGCHTRNGKDGLDPKLVEKLSVGLDPANANAEAVSPPALTGVAEKLLALYIDGVLLNNQRSRPWMSLQMPKFNPDNVRHLSKGLAALDGDRPQTAAVSPDFDGKTAEAGRTLVGEKGFGCIKCHDMLGIPSGGTRGPDLADVTARVNFEWYNRWMLDPQRIQPGTRMPTIFLNGQSPHKTILDGDPTKQREALWVYFQVAKRLPRPEGLNPPQKLHAPETAGPLVQRTFLHDTSPRGLAIRYPSGVHLAYDAQICRLSYAWSGDFLDMNPAWDGRGGGKANLEGSVFWTSPAGFPWEITSGTDQLPDFKDRETNTVFGAQSDKTTPQPPSRVHFKGYRTDGLNPTFMSTYDLEHGGTATIKETFATLRNEAALGFERSAAIKSPAAGFVWLHVAIADQPPSWRTLNSIKADGNSGTWSESGATISASAAISLVQQGHPYILQVKQLPANTVWRAINRDNQWTLLLRVPVSADAESKFTLALWSPLDDKLASAEKLLTGLLGK